MRTRALLGGVAGIFDACVNFFRFGTSVSAFATSDIYTHVQGRTTTERTLAFAKGGISIVDARFISTTSGKVSQAGLRLGCFGKGSVGVVQERAARRMSPWVVFRRPRIANARQMNGRLDACHPGGVQ